MIRNRRRGSLMLEFALVGIPTMFLTVSSIQLSMAMWQYHTLEECAATGARYVITHGTDCSGSCGVTVGNIITKIVSSGVGLDASKLSVTLVSNSSSPNGTTYSPASNYLSNSTAFPPSADGAVGDDITVTLKYTVASPLSMFFPGAAKVSSTSYALGATSRQRIVY